MLCTSRWPGSASLWGAGCRRAVWAAPADKSKRTPVRRVCVTDHDVCSMTRNESPTPGLAAWAGHEAAAAHQTLFDAQAAALHSRAGWQTLLRQQAHGSSQSHLPKRP